VKSIRRLGSAQDTEALGVALARSMRWQPSGPRLLFLSGELGAGKTTLAAAMLQALGAQEPARSPSYALIETYELRSGVAVHVDCYRLQGAQDLEQLGLRDYFSDQTLWLVEWPERVSGGLPMPDLVLQLEPAGDGRAAQIEARSLAGEAWLARLERQAWSQS
jgi:tRNA threonylcarbamoyladenosine biosynthesis protein TsaE